MNKGTKSVNNSLGGLKSMLGKIAIAAAAAFSIKKLIDFGKQSIETASDLQEVQNVVDTAFGESKQKMEDFANTAVETYGISKLTAKQTGSTFMAMASGMGIANDNASDMSVSLTGLSADMASFYNVQQDVAGTALKSVFTGETETLKQFGIVMTDANLQAYALSQGITKDTSAMTQAEKVQLRYNYVMQQTQLAQGDFAKTSDSWANQTRMLSEKWKEFGGTIGTVLMNIALPAVKTLNGVMTQLISLASQAAQAIADVFGIEMSTASSAASVADSTAETATDYSDIAQSAEDTEKSQENQLASFDHMNKLASEDKTSSDNGAGSSSAGVSAPIVTASADTKPLTSGILKALNGIKKMFSDFSKWFDNNFGDIFSGIWDGLKSEGQTLSQTFSKIFSDISTLVEPFKAYLGTTFTTWLQTVFSTCGTILLGLFNSFNMVFSDIWTIAVFPLLQNFITTLLPMLTEISTQAWLTTSTLFTSVKEIFDTLWTECISPILGFITQLWCDTVTLISDFWNKWGVPIFDGIRTAIETTKDTFIHIWESILKPCFEKIMSALDLIWTEHIKPLIAEFLDFVGELVNGALQIYNQFISPIVNWLIDLLAPIVKKIFGSMVNYVTDFVNCVIDVAKGVIKALKGVVQFIAGVFTGNWRGAWTGIKNIFKGIWEGLVAIAKYPINLIIELINGLTSAVESALNWIIDGINKLSFDVPDWFPVGGGATIGFNIGEIDIPEIPKLATGAVIPPNSEFLALLGDQKHGTNIEAPLSTIEQAVKNAMSGFDGGGGDITIVLTLDGKTVYKTVVDQNKINKRKTGNNPLMI